MSKKERLIWNWVQFLVILSMFGFAAFVKYSIENYGFWYYYFSKVVKGVVVVGCIGYFGVLVYNTIRYLIKSDKEEDK